MIADLVLASGSPRRKFLLEIAGFRFRVGASSFVEPPLKSGPSLKSSLIKLSIDKAETTRQSDGSRKPHSIYVGADTTVVLKNRVFGKPLSDEEAAQFLKSLSGKTHDVYSAWAIIDSEGKKLASGISKASVTWMPLDSVTIRASVASGEPRDKAGAYAFQGQALSWIRKITGSPSAIMGLPVHDMIPTLIKRGVPRW